MREVVLKGSDFQNIEEVHEKLAKDLAFPAYYGKNLSALYDVLTEADQETRIIIDFEGTRYLPLYRSLSRMAEVIGDAAEENEMIELELVNSD